MSNAPHPAAQAVPILQVAAALGISRDGRRAHCFNGPGHHGGQDNNPSLTFFSDYGRFKCYACGVKGDAIDLVRAVLGLGFREAVGWLERLAKEAPPGPAPPVLVGPAFAAPLASAATEVFRDLYRMTAAPDPNSLEGRYLAEKRGLDVAYAAICGVRVLRDLNSLGIYPPHKLAAAGLVSKWGRFLFERHPLWFFFFDHHRPVHICARDITGSAYAKELAPIGRQCPVPFNQDLLFIDKWDEIYICEGCIDTLSASQLGYPAIGVPGTQGFQREWFDLLRPVKRVRVLFDNDEAGHRAGIELRAQLRLHGIPADLVHPAHGKDVNDLLLHLRDNKHE
jgi:DNA primase